MTMMSLLRRLVYVWCTWGLWVSGVSSSSPSPPDRRPLIKVLGHTLQISWKIAWIDYVGQKPHGKVISWIQHACDAVEYGDILHYSTIIAQIDNVKRLINSKQESRALVRKPRDEAAVLFGLKFADNIHYTFKSSQASKARLHSSKHTGAKQNVI